MACRHAHTRSSVGSIHSTCSLSAWSCFKGGGEGGLLLSQLLLLDVGPLTSGVMRLPLCSIRYS